MALNAQALTDLLVRKVETENYLREHRDLFDRVTCDGAGGRVGWMRMPGDYDNRRCLPWTWVRGRYWYPWRSQRQANTALEQGVDNGAR